MDARILPAAVLGLSEGDVHVIRNAGGRVADAVRSLVISQQLLGTKEARTQRRSIRPPLPFRA